VDFLPGDVCTSIEFRGLGLVTLPSSLPDREGKSKIWWLGRPESIANPKEPLLITFSMYFKLFYFFQFHPEYF
jgi:hypothetical protein